MKTMTLLLACFGLIGFAGAAAAVTLDFEGIPFDYYYVYGMQNLDGYYPGVDFGPTVFILDRVNGGYNSNAYPPCSGNCVAASFGADTIRVDFDAPTNSVLICYTAEGAMFAEAYNSSDVLLGTAWAPGDNLGSNGFIDANWEGTAYLLIYSWGGFFTMDDFTYSEGSTPTQRTTWGRIKACYR